MSLLPKWKGKLELPPTPERRLKVGTNWIEQQLFLGAEVEAELLASQHAGHDLIRAKLAAPYGEFLLRHKNAKRVETSLPVFTSADIADHEALPGSFTLKWDSLGTLETYADTPEKVLDAWLHKFDFRTEDEAAGLAGLRAPQIAALHAISAHFTVGTEFEPASVVLPTGTGKTETMLATTIYRRLPRVLVIVPSDALRAQIGGKFIKLGILPTIATVVPPEIVCPRVAVIASGITSAEHAAEILKNANVIVTLPATLSASSPEAVSVLAEGCTDLIVDEAHHIPASTWKGIRERFDKKRVLQFTATPFRRDRARVDGRIVFNYKLGDAQAAGYYTRINLHTVEEYGEQEARDRGIATEAIACLRRDRDELHLDHLLMARTETKERADEVVAIYRELAPDLGVEVVYSGGGVALANKEALQRILDRSATGSRIVVCVNMLGEGYDLPNLKIAALHDTHKSLAITLQFIGRFTRRGAGAIGEATAVANIADETTEQKLADLYAEGADWDLLIKRLSEERIDEELKLQDVVLGLKESGDLHKHLSLWNLRPPLSAQFFRTECTAWNPENYVAVLPPRAESWHSYSHADEMLVAVVRRPSDVGWGDYEDFRDTIYDLIILRWDKDAGALCLFASDFKALRSEKMAEAVTDDKTVLVSGNPIFNILNNVELPLAKNLGSSRVGAISFTSYFGSNVTEGLDSIEKAQAMLNNIACLGYESGDRVLLGCTQRRGKVWQTKNGSIADWVKWTEVIWGKVATDDELAPNITRNFLRPQKLKAPHDSLPIAVQWGEQAQLAFNDRQFVGFGDVEVAVYEIDLHVGEVTPEGHIGIRVVSDIAESEYRLVIDEVIPAGYRHDHISGPKLTFRRGKHEQVPLEEHLVKDPFIIRYVDGTFSYNCFHIPTNLEAGMFPRANLESWDWSGIPLNDESMHKAGNQQTVQYRAFENLRDQFDVVFNDDGNGEAADLVCLKDVDDETLRLCLVHCKGAHEGRVSADIRNFYTVCGQAQKSITAKHVGLPTLIHDLKARHEIWVKQGVSRFLKGDLKALQYFKEKSRRAKIEFDMVLVQPGASIATISDDILRLLGTTELYLSKTTQAKFRVVVSS